MAEKLKFTDEHLWARVEGTQVHIGLSDFLQAKLGEIISVQLPDVGDEIERGEPFGELESSREVHELIAPITGVVVSINTDLEDHPAIVNEDPYHEGWLIEVELRDENELDELIEPDEYEELIAGEEEEEE
ncbi:MAG TPA: glycine cleavage system protein GcvH [Candidatus Bathyarchaeia archaeon]|nr:glycine cleavage system protein GcvH [Candidatus Bathyarchaeia archaeon]